jgi:DNA-binding MarR family transcriptional regulator/GNAT superfamily N-acetyltransferase
VHEERDIAAVRAFNRLVTRQAGVLNDRHVGRRPLGESRVLYEIGESGATPRDLRARLGLDSGYVSRLIRALEGDGLIERTTDPRDRRTKRLVLTPAGRGELRRIDRVSDELAAAVLEPLTPQQRERLLAAQAEVRRLLAISLVEVAREDPSSPDARWCLGHYFEELDARFAGGFAMRTMPAAEAAQLSPRDGVFLLARVGGPPAGCGGLRRLGPDVGEIVRMWVDRPHRGLGVGRRLLAELEACAAEIGLTTVRLDSNRALDVARSMYAASGYAEIARYNDNPYADHWFEKRLG